MLTLCFDRQANYLGELLTENGALKHWTLTHAGEKAIGAHMGLWQTRGIPVTRGILKGTDAAGSHTYYRSYTQLRSQEFHQALLAWGAERGMLLIDLDPKRLTYWEHLLRLPLEPVERLTVLLAIRPAPEEQMIEWREILESAELAGMKGRDRARRRLQALLRKAGGVHAKSFASDDV